MWCSELQESEIDCRMVIGYIIAECQAQDASKCVSQCVHSRILFELYGDWSVTNLAKDFVKTEFPCH